MTDLIQHIEWVEKTKPVIDALKRFQKSKNRWDNKQLTDSIEEKIETLTAQGTITDKMSEEAKMKAVIAHIGLSKSEEQVK